MKKWTRDDLILFYYGELNESENLAVSQALKESVELNVEYQQLCEFLDESLTFEIPEPGENFEQRIMANISQLQSDQKVVTAPKRKSFFSLESWLSAGGLTGATLAACCLTIGLFLLGRWSVIEPQMPEYTDNVQYQSDQKGNKKGLSESELEENSGTFSQQARHRMLLKNVSLHMQSSDRLLTLVSNGDADLTAQIDNRKSVIQDMLAFNRIYRRVAEKSGDLALVELLERMESVLLEINHTDLSTSQSDWINIQQRIKSNDLIYQLRVNNNKLNKNVI